MPEATHPSTKPRIHNKIFTAQTVRNVLKKADYVDCRYYGRVARRTT